MKKYLVLAVILLPSLLLHAAPKSAINRADRRILNEYIVEFKPDVSRGRATSILATSGVAPHDIRVWYDTLMNGALIETNERGAEELAAHPQIVSVEENATFSVAASQSTGPNLGSGVADRWALDRIDQRSPSDPRLNGTYNYCTTGAGVRAYIVDTGVLAQHAEFGGRVDTGAGTALTQHLASNGINLGKQCWESSIFSPAASHGTSVASLLGGATYGIAKGVTLIDARALSCSGVGDAATVIKVLEWIATDPGRTGKRSVVNMSISGSKYQWDSSSVGNAITSLVNNHNIAVVVSAGNHSGEVDFFSPSNVSAAITVGGTNKDLDTRWSYSNYGRYVDFYAPAQFIESASTAARPIRATNDLPRSRLNECDWRYTADTCTSGTSFSAPLVAGLITRYLQQNPSVTQAGIISHLNAEANHNGGILISSPDGYWQQKLVGFYDCP